jgi:hypothetical protein
MTAMKAAAGIMLFLSLVSARTPADAIAAAGRRPAPEPSLRLWVTPRFTRAPAVVRIQAFVEPVPDNRRLEFVIESSEYYRSSVIELSGADAPRVHGVEFRAIPAGTHDVRVVLTGRAGGARAVEHDRIAVSE